MEETLLHIWASQNFAYFLVKENLHCDLVPYMQDSKCPMSA